MAKTYSNLTEEELKEKILMIADYIIETKCSTRKAAKYATENGFPISNVSVHNMIHKKLPKIDLERYQKIMKILSDNAPKSIEDANTKIRIYTAVSYLLQDFTIEEIAKMTDSTFDIIYDDLTTRLPKLDAKLAKGVKSKLLEHKLENLGQYKEGVSQEIIEEKVKEFFAENEKKNIGSKR